jgi:hypothetical protein
MRGPLLVMERVNTNKWLENPMASRDDVEALDTTFY